MWEYVKGSEEDFEGAPDWATHLTFCSNENPPVDDGESRCWTTGIVRGERWQATDSKDLNSTINKPEEWHIIAERRKVDDLQTRTNDANLQQAFDTVQRPAHYNQSGIECIDAIAASMSAEEFQAYLKGNVQKYLWRYQHKNGLEDVRKAEWYLNRLVKELSK